MRPRLVRATMAALGSLPVLAGCGPWQRVGTEDAPDPNLVVPRLFDPTPIYRGMGMFAQPAPVAFVASTRVMAGPTPDTALVVFGLSLANNQLSFRRAGDGFEARYRVDVLFQRGGRLVHRIASEETVRIAAFQESVRSDESVIYQQLAAVPADSYTVDVRVQDVHGGLESRARGGLRVPRLTTGAVTVIPVFTADTLRRDRRERPALLVNPRATVPFGLDSLRLVVEALGDGAEPRLLVRTPEGRTVVDQAVPLAAGDGLSAARVALAPGDLPVGELLVQVARGADTVSLPALISFSDQWAITNFDDVLDLLRYFGAEPAIAEMRDADPAERPALWRRFWTATDPNPVTPDHEALEQYFQRVEQANRRFSEGGDAGWLSDRGEVYIVLGDPDEIFDQSSDFQGGRRVIRWTYLTDRLTLDFVDDAGFGHFRLTPASRAEFTMARQRRERQP